MEGIEEVERRLQELEARIEDKRKALAEHGVLGQQLKAEWDDMMRRHAEIRRRLRMNQANGSKARATLAQDIDVLRHAVFRWAAHVDEHFKARP